MRSRSHESVRGAVALILLAACASVRAGAGRIADDVLVRPAHPTRDAKAQGDLGVVRAGTVEVNLDRLARAQPSSDKALRLLLFNDVGFDVLLERAETQVNDRHAWFGKLVGVPGGRATVVVHGGIAAISIHAGKHGSYVVRPSGDGTYVCHALDAKLLSHCGGSPGMPRDTAVRGTEVADAVSLASVTAPGSLSAAEFGCDDGSIIDLLVVYTTDARTAVGSTAAIESLIDLAVADANDALTRSLIATQVRLVHSEEISYVESGIADVDGPRLIIPDDGYLDEVHVLRDAYGADCVSVWVANLDSGGIGYFPDPSLAGVGASGLSLLRQDNATLLTLAHELGHNLFCAHDRPNAPDPPFAEYSYGYQEPGAAWRTIMAVSSGTVIPHFANPDVDWLGPVPGNPGPTGVPVGQPEPSDVARTINATRLFVANFRPTAVPGLPAVLYVAADAPPGGDGLGWTTAFRDLQDALCAAAGSGGAVHEVWVKSGTYAPDRGTGNRGASFRLANGVEVLGGFDGTETLRSERNPTANATVLSGDIGAPSDSADNSYHVVTASRLDATAVLDGFVITHGNADASDPHDGGGGLLVYDGGNATVIGCAFTDNQATRGGGLYCYGGASPTLVDCAFDANTSTGAAWPDGGGGAYCNSSCNPDFVRCTFRQNSANLGGGLALLFDCNPTLTNSTFARNTAAEGGGMYSYANCHAVLTNVLFSGNSAAYGGAMNNLFTSNAQLVNCTLVGNTADSAGGGVYSYENTLRLANTILWDNRVGSFTNQAEQIYIFNGPPTVDYCTIQGGADGLGGTGNNGADPLFVDADGPDDVYGTTDDDARPQVGSPAIDSGDNASLPVGVVTDLDGAPRLQNGTIDRGAYEFGSTGAPPVPATGHWMQIVLMLTLVAAASQRIRRLRTG